MSVFQDITFEFKDKEYTVKSNAVFRLIAQIDEIVTLSELLSQDKEAYVSPIKICEAFACCIRYAGGTAKAEDVYGELFGDNPLNPRDVIVQLQMFVVPPSKYITVSADDDLKKKKMIE